jgi:ABC-type Zn uptake system ZnuABC Zn-binding protein ZnuA
VAGADGAEMEVEETLPVQCAGLDGGILLDLEPGEYVIALSGLAEEMTPFFAGSAGGHHHHHEGDPHFWLDPNNVVKYVENIRDGLIAADPDGKDIYTQNAASYIAQLNELDAWIKQQVNAIPEDRRLIVTNHESFGYFADRYGFKIIGTIIPSVSTGSSPSAQQMARLVDHIRETGAIAIFLETGSNPKLAEQIAQETGVKVVSDLYTHSITEPGGKAPTYIDMMKYNVQAIVEALK